jgi:hypothetical protein
MSAIELLFALDQLLFLVGEVNKLIEGFLVDVAVLLQFGVTLIQLLEQLLAAHKEKF